VTDALSQHQHSCRPADVAAYLDGELDAASSEHFAQHARECASCAAALNEQKRLLCLLDVAFPVRKAERDFALPEHFARVVTAHARTDMSGVRHRTEHRRAFVLCALLATVAFSLLGLTRFDAALAPLAAFARALTGILGMLAHALGDAATSAAVILRTVGGHFIAAPHPLKALTWMLVFACAALLLLRLIGSYHRARRENF
jgi:anti-sigma factor RsiW